MAEISRGKAAGFYDKKEKVKDKSIDNLSLEEVTELLDKLRRNVTIEHATETIQSNNQSQESDNKIS
jgi:hypothetical protein